MEGWFAASLQTHNSHLKSKPDTVHDTYPSVNSSLIKIQVQVLLYFAQSFALVTNAWIKFYFMKTQVPILYDKSLIFLLLIKITTNNHKVVIYYLIV